MYEKRTASIQFLTLRL